MKIGLSVENGWPAGLIYKSTANWEVNLPWGDILSKLEGIVGDLVRTNQESRNNKQMFAGNCRSSGLARF